MIHRVVWQKNKKCTKTKWFLQLSQFHDLPTKIMQFYNFKLWTIMTSSLLLHLIFVVGGREVWGSIRWLAQDMMWAGIIWGRESQQSSRAYSSIWSIQNLCEIGFLFCWYYAKHRQSPYLGRRQIQCNVICVDRPAHGWRCCFAQGCRNFPCRHQCIEGVRCNKLRVVCGGDTRGPD